MDLLERRFKLRENGTTVSREIVAGVVTFVTMAYIIFVNPSIISQAGIPFEAGMIATCVAAAFGTVAMALLSNYPFALAPGMGLNAYFTYTLVQGMGVPWETALGAVFLSGAVFVALTLSRAREAIIDAVPQSLKASIAAGVGVFIAFIGLRNAGIVVSNPATWIGLGNFSKPGTLLAALGFIITGVLQVMGVRAAILLGILLTFVIGIPMGVTQLPDRIVAVPSLASWSPVLGELRIGAALELGLATVIFTMFFVDMFDSAGTFIGLAQKAGYLDQHGKLPRARQALLADALATMAGAWFGTPTVTTYVESASGIASGGRTGLTGMVVALLFLMALPFAPLVAAVPAAATAPALILVGAMMISSINKVEWSDPAQAIPAFVAVITMALTFSVANGVFLSIITYSALHTFSGRFRQVNPLIHVLAVLFILKFVILGSG